MLKIENLFSIDAYVIVHTHTPSPLKVMGNEKNGRVKVVSIDRSWFSELSLLIFTSF